MYNYREDEILKTKYIFFSYSLLLLLFRFIRFNVPFKSKTTRKLKYVVTTNKMV